MVALQILALPVGVRIPHGQLLNSKSREAFFVFIFIVFFRGKNIEVKKLCDINIFGKKKQ